MAVWTPQKNTWASAGSVARNKGPIADALDAFLSKNHSPVKCILEIASGFGDHVTLFAQRQSAVQFQPTEAQAECLQALSRLDLANILPPLRLNVLDESDWDVLLSRKTRYDGIININMIHISPIESTDALFRNAAALLNGGGFILLYGAYLADDGSFTSPADETFNAVLKEKDSSFGLRLPSLVDASAKKYNFQRISAQTMALNNRLFIWRFCQP